MYRQPLVRNTPSAIAVSSSPFTTEQHRDILALLVENASAWLCSPLIPAQQVIGTSATFDRTRHYPLGLLIG